MGNRPKVERNRRLVEMRDVGFTWSTLARIFGISEATACKIYKRDSSKEGRYEAKWKTSVTTG